MKINNNTNTDIFILNVGRGLSIIIKTSQSYCIIYDFCSTSYFSPIKLFREYELFNSFSIYSEPHLPAKKIAQFIISHPHLDHISDLTNENCDFINNNSFYITCQNDKADGNSIEDNKVGHKINFNRINNPDEAADEILNYKNLYKFRKLPLSTLVHYDESITNNLKIGYYYLTHKQVDELFPTDNQKYSNSLSIVLYISHGKGI